MRLIMHRTMYTSSRTIGSSELIYRENELNSAVDCELVYAQLALKSSMQFQIRFLPATQRFNQNNDMENCIESIEGVVHHKDGRVDMQHSLSGLAYLVAYLQLATIA